jgi:choline dehydrogenase
VSAQESVGFEYIVVGSGAGGGVVAARLAEAGHTVLLLEAGGDYKDLEGGGPVSPDQNRLPEDYEVPTFHAMSTENTALKWDFFVRHYEDQAQSLKDDKFVKDHDGVLYPRAGTLGGCTAHDAMIMVYPHNADWDHIAEITGDPSWRARRMRRYFQRLENCRHRWPYRLLYRLTSINPTRHGFSGWLSIEKAVPKAALHDTDLIKIVTRAVWNCFWHLADRWERITWFLRSQGDPNDWRLVKKNAIGVHYAPIHTHKHARNSTREFLLDVAERHPDRLKIELNALATEVLFDDSNRAIGVAYLKGSKLYRASYDPNKAPGEAKKAYVKREVILAGGAFNTPQLLMLSGIGPKEQLAKDGIAVRVNLPGVGSNLQDRYEVGIVNRLKEDWDILKKATFTRDDPQCKEWVRWRKGVYTTNGAAVAIIKRSLPERPLPDLFVFALIGRFQGYFPGYSKLIADNHNYLTWCILKAHTNNRGGTVTLRTKDPRDPPRINFHYFTEGTDREGEDLQSLVAGIEFVRTLTAEVGDIVVEEELPGKSNQTAAELTEFAKDNAWGHHASCTCQIGPSSEPMAVLDSNFQVYGTSNLRVVDASVFPRIPGFFIVSCVYMIAEKASDAILASAGHAKVPRCVYGDGFWCNLSAVVKWIACWFCWVLQALKPLGKALLALIAALLVALVALVAIVGANWFIFEPPSEKPDLAEEQRTVQSIVQVLTGKLNKQYEGVLHLRDTHPKANACVKANVTINPNLPPALKIGFLKGKPNGDQTYKAWIRFSNAADHITGDPENDFRGMAIKMFGVSGERLPVPGDESDTQDLLFIANNAFFAGSPQHFHDFFAACVKGGGSCDPMQNPYVVWHLLTHPHGAYNLLTGRRAYPSIADIKWFSVAPFDLGDDDHVIKYSAFPAEQQAQYSAPGQTPYYLQQRLENLLDPANSNHLRLNLQIQMRADPATEPIENTLVPWSEATSPWQKIAVIDIYPQIFASTAQQEFCERLTFNPWHGLKAHLPRGGINRARRDVMHAMQDVRLDANHSERFGPSQLIGDETFK